MTPIRRLYGKIQTFRAQERFVQMWFLPAWTLLGLSRLSIRIVSFRRLAPRLGVSVGPVNWIPLLPDALEHRASRIGRTVRLAARFTPWDSNCLTQAVAARVLLGFYRVPYAIFFGVLHAPADQEYRAHAWIAAGRVQVTGGSGFGRYTVVGCFVAPRLARKPLAAGIREHAPLKTSTRGFQ